ncbi:HNH endonuclease [Burkholderia ubonensis]|uniref:HNH endonuclease n=1 Tax=Burkholderia ubonensis TaxID=101571 RepID=UPI001E3CC53A|nr:HNH endonuclease signature motif containing protein [Burkholderia ubonensis]
MSNPRKLNVDERLTGGETDVAEKKRMHIEARFYETYELCEIVQGVLTNRFDHLLKLEGFHCDGQWAAWTPPYRKYSAFHQFIEFIVREVHAEQAEVVDLSERKKAITNFSKIPDALDSFRPEKLPIEIGFDYHGIDYYRFCDFLSDNGRPFHEADEDDVYEFMNETFISEPYGKLMDQTVKEVFHVLFQNRGLLLLFNRYASDILSHAHPDDADELDLTLFTRSGVLKRVKPPAWARRAVFFRDRGRCVMCDKDLSGLTNLDNIENYDHIVPLKRFGLNDVSNLQLLCERCNQHEKRDGAAVTSIRYQSWYEYN